MKNEKWIKLKRTELNNRIAQLATKIAWVTVEAKKFGPKKYRKGLKIYGLQRSGMIRHWEKMAKQSLMSTRKKIYCLQSELKAL